MAKFRIAIAGATGAVGREIIRLLEEKAAFIQGSPIFLAGKQGAEEMLPFLTLDIPVFELEDYDFKDVDLTFFATPKQVTDDYAPKALAAGSMVIDASGAMAADGGVPLVPRVNDEVLNKARESRKIASPNPVSIQLALALKALQARGHVKRVITSALVPASYFGKAGMDEVFRQSAGLLGGAGAEEMTGEVFSTQSAFNVLPLVGEGKSGGPCSFEHQVMQQLPKIIDGLEDVQVSAAMVPTFVGISQIVWVALENDLSVDQARELFTFQEGLEVIDDVADKKFSTPFGAAETDAVHISRMRNGARKNELLFWLTGDNLRKGSALNMLQIFDLLAAD